MDYLKAADKLVQDFKVDDNTKAIIYMLRMIADELHDLNVGVSELTDQLERSSDDE